MAVQSTESRITTGCFLTPNATQPLIYCRMCGPHPARATFTVSSLFSRQKLASLPHGYQPQVHSVAGLIPPELLAQAETEWRQQSSVIKVSHTHK